MARNPIESVQPEDARFFSVAEIVELSGLSETEVVTLVECGALSPAEEGAEKWSFSVQCLTLARTARRLRDDFELDPQGVELALTLLGRIHALEAELMRLRARLPRAF